MRGGKPCQIDLEEGTEKFFRPVEGRYLDQALDRALFFLEQGLTERAVIMLEVLHGLEPENPRVTLSYAEALLADASYDCANTILSKARFADQVGEAQLLQAIILIRQQRPAEAQERLIQVLDTNATAPQRVKEKAESILARLSQAHE